MRPDYIAELESENARLRELIEYAPHNDNCVQSNFIAAGWKPQGRCICWKADAL